MLDFSKITIVSITGLQSIASGALRSIMHSAEQMPGAKCLLLSPEKPKETPEWVKHSSVKPFGYLEYSIFILYSLTDFIETEFALVVQDDGWVVSLDGWRNDFYRYDYIGAPVHLARITKNQSTIYEHGFGWVNYLGDADAQIENIFNGGFSLRSKKLLDAPRKLKLNFEIPCPDVNIAEPYGLHWKNMDVLEDVWLCLSARRKLEESGIIFPGLEVAKHFSVEHKGPILHHADALPEVFGHHSKLRKLTALEPKEITYLCSKEFAQTVYGENSIINLFQNRGYKINWP